MVTKIHIYIPHIDLYVRRKKILFTFIYAAFHYFVHSTDRKWILLLIGTNIGNITPGRALSTLFFLLCS